MTTTTVSPELFRAEAERRLIDSYGLAQALGLRSHDSLKRRVERGELPRPVFQSTTITLWDRDAALPTEGAR